MIEFIEINDITYINNNDGCIVNDLTISNNHTYVANNYIVHNCITSSNVSVHYPIASLIDECNDIKQIVQSENMLRTAAGLNTTMKSCPKIVADGGIRGYADVIKALGLGADYVMIGSLFTGLLESAAPLDIECYNSHYKYSFKDNGLINDGVNDIANIWEPNVLIYWKMKDGEDAWESWKRNFIHDMKSITKESYGMSTKKAQKLINPNAITKTSEGCTKYIQVKETVHQWTDNMISYLKSAMSYTDCKTLEDFIGKGTFVLNSNCTVLAVNK